MIASLACFSLGAAVGFAAAAHLAIGPRRDATRSAYIQGFGMGYAAGARAAGLNQLRDVLAAADGHEVAS